MSGHWEELANIVFLDKETGARTKCVISRHLASDWRYLRMAKGVALSEPSDGAAVLDRDGAASDPPDGRAAWREATEELSGELPSDVVLMRALGLPLAFTNKPPAENGDIWVARCRVTPPPPVPAALSRPTITSPSPSSVADKTCVTSPGSVTSSADGSSDWLQCRYGGGEGTAGLHWTPVQVCEENIVEEEEVYEASHLEPTAACRSEADLPHRDSGRGVDQEQCWQRWEQHWAACGEETVLRTWTEKYRDYIDPEYLTAESEENPASSERAPTAQNTASSLDAAPETAANDAPAVSVETVGVTSPETVGLTSPETVGVTSPETVGVTSPETVGVTSPETVGVMSPETVGVTSPETAGVTSPETVGVTSPGLEPQVEVRSWDELWQQHYQQVYDQMYAEFSGGSGPAGVGSDGPTSRRVPSGQGEAGAELTVEPQPAEADGAEQNRSGLDMSPSIPKRKQKRKKSSRRARELQVQSVGALLSQLQDGRLSPVGDVAESPAPADSSSQRHLSDGGTCASDTSAPSVEALERRTLGGEGRPEVAATAEDNDTPERMCGGLQWAEGALTMLGFCHSLEGAGLSADAAHVQYKQKRLKQKTRALNMIKTGFTDEHALKKRLPQCSVATDDVTEDTPTTAEIGGAAVDDVTEDTNIFDDVSEDTPNTIENGGTVVDVVTEDTATFDDVTGAVCDDFSGDPSVPEELRCSPELAKYWYQRYRLFSRFDAGVRLSGAAWFSVTPEQIARHLATRCRRPVLVDAFCGAGGNAIQFARTCGHVVAVDRDPEQLTLARHNAHVYGVAHRITFLLADFFRVAGRLRADAVFLSPPWGGPRYCQEEVYDMFRLDGTMDGRDMMRAARQISSNMAVLAPRNANTHQLVALADGSHVELEQNLLNGKIKTITAYYGDLVTGS